MDFDSRRLLADLQPSIQQPCVPTRISGRAAGKHESYKIQAKDRNEMDEWIKCIRAAMMKDPVYELYVKKRTGMG